MVSAYDDRPDGKMDLNEFHRLVDDLALLANDISEKIIIRNCAMGIYYSRNSKIIDNR